MDKEQAENLTSHSLLTTLSHITALSSPWKNKKISDKPGTYQVTLV